MAKAPAGFAEFVDARGPALIRTASLLELDDAAAQDAVVEALAKAARQWRALSRDGNAEAEVRRNLHETVVGKWLRAHTLDTVPPTDAVDDDASSARTALAKLTNRERVLVVLSGFESLTSREIATLLRCTTAEVDAGTESAATDLRRAAGVALDAPLLPLLNSAAFRDVPPDLADRALAASRQGGRRTFAAVVAGAVVVLAVVAVAIALLPKSDDGPPDDSVAASIERWGIPAEVPPARGLPSLAEQPIETASMAYVVGGRPIVVDAATGDARTVLAGQPQPAWYDGDIGGVTTGLLRRGPPWTQAVLSPDGAWLLLVQAPRELRLESSFGRAPPAPTGDLYLVRVSTGQVTPVPDARPVSRAQGVAGVADTVLAWAPGAGAFACVCGGGLAVYDLEPTVPRVLLLSQTPIAITDVVWGGEGLMARLVDGGWISRSGEVGAAGRLGLADAVAASTVSPPVYLGVGVTSTYALGADTAPDGGRCVLWDADFTLPVPVTPVPDRDGVLCTPVALQPGRSGVLLVVRPDRPRPQPLPLDVVTVDTFGASTVIGTLPPGTTFASFAARLAG